MNFFLFLKTNELTDFISSISWLALTINCATLLLLAPGLKVTASLSSAKHRNVGSSPALDKNFFVQVSWLCETFFCKFFQCLYKGPPSFVFYFAEEWMFKNFKRALLNIFRHYATYRRRKNSKQKFKKKSEFFQYFCHALEENTWHFATLLLILSLSYGADLGRSHLVFLIEEKISKNCVHYYRSFFPRKGCWHESTKCPSPSER